MSQRYRPGTSHKPQTADTFREQMADYVRGEQLKRLRDEAHKSRETVAAEIGVTTKTLYSWEHGGKIKWENARKIGAYYNVDPESLVTRDNGDVPVFDREQSQLDRMEASLVALHDKLNALLATGVEDEGLPDLPPELQPSDSESETAPKARSSRRRKASTSRRRAS